MAQLADVALVQRPPGGVGQHGPAGQLAADLLRTPPQLPEGTVLRLAQRRDRAGQADPGGLARVGRLENRSPFGDREHSQRRTLWVLQDHVPGVRRYRVGGHLERHRHRPGCAVDQQAAFADRGRVGRCHEPAQRRERPRREQLEIPQLRLVERARRPFRELRGQPGQSRWGRCRWERCGSGGYLSRQVGLRGSSGLLITRTHLTGRVAGPAAGTSHRAAARGGKLKGFRERAGCTKTRPIRAARIAPQTFTTGHVAVAGWPGQGTNSDHRDIMSLAGLLTILDDDPQLHDVVSRAESDTIPGGRARRDHPRRRRSRRAADPPAGADRRADP